ncbi:MAG: hypothetical protein U0T82_06030 [Bacteroidales bacterium]
MNIQKLQKSLLEAYTVPNLNKISLVLLDLYKNQQYSSLKSIAEIIEDSVKIEIDENGKGFSRLMMLYHPDRAGYHRSEIDRLAGAGDLEGLLGYSHILKLERIEEISKSLDGYEDIDYSPVYEWDVDAEGFRIVNDSSDEEEGEKRSSGKEKVNFYEAVKIRIYGGRGFDFPVYYLEDWEELEMSEANIHELEGIQYCIHVRNFDLSGNYIYDLSPLSSLKAIEELNLSGNNISILDDLVCLPNLRNLDISNNPVADVEPLLQLPKLENVILTGTRVKADQIEMLREAGVTLII